MDREPRAVCTQTDGGAEEAFGTQRSGVCGAGTEECCGDSGRVWREVPLRLSQS